MGDENEMMKPLGKAPDKTGKTMRVVSFSQEQGSPGNQEIPESCERARTTPPPQDE